MEQLIAFTDQHTAELIAGLALACIVFLLVTIALLVKMRAIGKRADVKLTEGSARDFANCITDLTNRVTDIEMQLGAVLRKQPEIMHLLEKTVCYVGMVRFNAFSDIGGEQSFALALLDRNKDGVVISNLYGRQDMRVYAKMVREGKSGHKLSEEERKAISTAISGKSEQVAEKIG